MKQTHYPILFCQYQI